jgi:hypothetical protein
MFCSYRCKNVSSWILFTKYAFKCTCTYMLYVDCSKRNISDGYIEYLIVFTLFEVWKHQKGRTPISYC